MELFCKKCGCESEYFVEIKSNNHCAYCKTCGCYIKNVPYVDARMYFGRYKGMKIQDIDDLPYLHWLLENTDVSGHIKEAIEIKISNTKTSS